MGTTEAPIFIVGVPRSGTTLLAALLAAHSRLSCGPETHVLSFARGAGRSSRSFQKNWPQTGVEFLEANEHVGKSVIDNYGVSREAVHKQLEHWEPGLQSLLRVLPELERIRAGKARWVEKTPNHLGEVQLIRKLFPDSPIIQIVRDPRDVALSLTKVPWGRRGFLQGLEYWRQFQTASRRFFETDPRSKVLKYEDLLLDPVRTLQTLCEFLGESFESEMLDTSKSGAAVNRAQEPWKVRVTQSIEAGLVKRWKQEATVAENCFAEALLGDQLDRFQYDREHAFRRYWKLCTAIKDRNFPELSRLAEAGIRFWADSKSERPEAACFLGDPDQAFWFSGGIASRLTSVAQVVATVALCRLRGMEIAWVREPPQTKPSKCARLVTAALPRNGANIESVIKSN